MHKQIITAAGLVLLSLAGLVGGAEVLPAWQRPAAVEETPFELGTGKGEYKAWGRDKDYRVFSSEFLPVLFERTVALDRFDSNCGLVWIFTGEHGGFTVTISHRQVSLYQRFYDSPGFEKRFEGKRLRHPEKREPAAQVEYDGRLRAVTVKMDHKLGLSVALNGKVLLQQECLLDVSRHQLRLTGNGEISGKMLEPAAEPAVVRINPDVKYQTMMGFGGTSAVTTRLLLSILSSVAKASGDGGGLCASTTCSSSENTRSGAG